LVSLNLAVLSAIASPIIWRRLPAPLPHVYDLDNIPFRYNSLTVGEFKFQSVVEHLSEGPASRQFQTIKLETRNEWASERGPLPDASSDSASATYADNMADR
tara:strand:- start:610 stop:915 length:306 start_codon:yes stop_codon:yes gene_type:complete